MNFNKFFSVKIFLFLITFFFVLPATTQLVNLNEFRKVIETAEFFYSKESGEQVDFYEKLDVLDSLYAYKKKYREYLFYNNFLHDQEYQNVKCVFSPLVKQVIRLLEIHLEDVHSYNPKTTFARIVPTVFYTGSITVCALGVCELLKRFEVISEQNYHKTRNRISLVAPGITALWFAYNYKDHIYRKLKTGFGKRKIVYRKLVEKPEEQDDVVEIKIEDDDDGKKDDIKKEVDIKPSDDFKKLSVQVMEDGSEGVLDDTGVRVVRESKEVIEKMK